MSHRFPELDIYQSQLSIKELLVSESVNIRGEYHSRLERAQHYVETQFLRIGARCCTVIGWLRRRTMPNI